MPFNIMTLSRVAMPVSLAEGLKILERDHFCCRYCGLDGKASLENALVMSVDFVVPRAHKGKKSPANLVACCRACNMIKGTRVYKNFDEAQRYVLAQREKLRDAWEAKYSPHARPVDRAEASVELCAGI
ncbi:MAG TPA: HNH endonuclease [Candidatus Limnocylindrales bacterium]|nr:HNH endonuclease [Candidatus Limnocylindrales bacterium]